MGKKQSGSVPNRAIYSRLSYLYQAAAYLQSQGLHSPSLQPQGSLKLKEQAHAEGANHIPSPTETKENQPEKQRDIHAIASRRLLSDLRAASLKTQIRLDPSVKRTVCKFCDTLLVEGASCHSFVENKSKGGRKPWADVLVMRCGTCGGEKRFPVSTARQKRRSFRGGIVESEEGQAKGKGGVPVRRKEKVAGGG